MRHKALLLCVLQCALVHLSSAYAQAPCSVVLLDCAQRETVTAGTPSLARKQATVKERLDANRARLANANSPESSSVSQALHSVVVEGQAEPAAGDAVKNAFNRNLPAPKRTGIEHWARDDGARCMVDHDCRGVFCSAVCTAGDGSMGNQRPGGFSVR
jgi:hypothetical protein